MVTLYQEARTALRESGFRPRRRLGQHFLIQEHVLETIVRLADLSAQDEVVEIGPGLGFLTRRLLKAARRVWAVEVDPFLVEWLRRSPLGSQAAFELVQGDVLELDLEAMLPAHRIKLVANLPYSISTPVLFRLFESRSHFSFLVLMVQQEVAERMAGAPGTKAYGTLSVWCQIHGRIVERVPVSPEAFFPRPKVRSAILKMDLYPAPLLPSEDMPLLRRVVRAAFGQRRKILSNALRGLIGGRSAAVESLLRQEGIDPRRRGETLSVSEFIRLARALKTVVSFEAGDAGAS